MKIPSSIRIADTKIDIEWKGKLLFQEGCSGTAEYRKNKIYIQPSTKNHPRSKEDIENTFLHEVTHWILLKMENELRDNEVFVGQFASLLTQALRSGRII